MVKKMQTLWRRIIGDGSPARVFLLLLIVSWASVLIAAIFTEGKALKNLFFIAGNDLFMDLFNSMRDASTGIAAYTERMVIYPPMANFLFLALSKIMPEAYLSTPSSERLSWPNYTASYVVIVLFLLLLVATFFVACRGFRTKSANPWILSIAFLFSEASIYGLERGNVVMLSTAATLFFLANYTSESKALRELSLIAIAFAFSLKLYPAVFAWMLITDKRYKEAARCALYGLIMLILPCFACGGPVILLWIVKNILSFATYRGGIGFNVQPWHLWMRLGDMVPVYYTFVAIALVLFFLLSFLRRDRQRDLTLLCAIVLAIPSFQSFYACTLLVAPLILLFEQKKWTPWSISYFVLLVFPMLPMPFVVQQNTPGECLFPTMSFLLLLLCIADGIWFLVKKYRKQEHTV